jgi:hypothetical protein
MMKRSAPAGLLVGTVAIAMLLASCGGGESPKQEEATSPPKQDETTPPPTSGTLSRSDVEACLSDAGLELATGDTPLISEAKAIGINPGKGTLQPGDITAAVFVYSSEEEAGSAAASLEGAPFDEVVQEGSIMIVYAEPPPAGERTAIEGCTSSG